MIEMPGFDLEFRPSVVPAGNEELLAILGKVEGDLREEFEEAIEWGWDGEAAQEILGRKGSGLNKKDVAWILARGEANESRGVPFWGEPVTLAELCINGWDTACHCVDSYSAEPTAGGWRIGLSAEAGDDDPELAEGERLPSMGELIAILEARLEEYGPGLVPDCDGETPHWTDYFAWADNGIDYEFWVRSDVYPELEAYYRRVWEERVERKGGEPGPPPA